MNNQQDLAAFLMRVALGVMFIAHGWLKLKVFTLAGTAAFFDSVGLPGFMAYPVTFAEIIGGLFLVLGLWVRPTALLLVPVLLGASWVHWGNGWLFSAANGGWEYPVFLTVTAVAVAMLGAGRFSVLSNK